MNVRKLCSGMALVLLAVSLFGCASLMGFQYKDYNGVKTMFVEEKVDGVSCHAYIYLFKKFRGAQAFKSSSLTLRVMDHPDYPRFVLAIVGQVGKPNSMSLVIDGTAWTLPLLDFTRTYTTTPSAAPGYPGMMDMHRDESASYLIEEPVRGAILNATELAVELNGSLTKILEEDLANLKALLR